MQRYEPNVLLQLPPFRHGDELQPSTTCEQVGPVYPGLQEHVNVLLVLLLLHMPCPLQVEPPQKPMKLLQVLPLYPGGH